MALIFLGSSKCALCSEILLPGDDITALPAIGVNDNPLSEYFDSGFHLVCFDNWNEKTNVLRLVKDAKQKYLNSDEAKAMITKYGIPDWLKDSE